MPAATTSEMLRSTIPRLDLQCCATPRHRSTGTQTGAWREADAAATVVELVRQCALKYETVARRHRQQLAGLESVLGRLRQGDVGCPDGLDGHALHGTSRQAHFPFFPVISSQCADQPLWHRGHG